MYKIDSQDGKKEKKKCRKSEREKERTLEKERGHSGACSTGPQDGPKKMIGN